MSKKLNLNIREKIRSGEIDTDKAGKLLSVHYYTGGTTLSDSDERALRETAKDVRLFNAYMGGGRAIKDGDIFLIAISKETRLANQTLQWIGAELKHTINSLYTPPRIVAVTEDKYEAIGKEKRERRLKRTYTLTTLYRVLIEGFIKYPEGKDEERILADLREYPEDATEGYMYGIDLIDPNGKGDVIEYWRGWIPNHFNSDKLDTLDELAKEIPEAHKVVMTKLEALYKAKKLSIDPNAIPLEKYHETPLKGSELGVIAEDVKYLAEILSTPEANLLDNYLDEGEDKRTADNRYIFEKYRQAYAILKNPERYRLKDGELDYDPFMETPLAYGYRVGGNPEAISAQLPLETIKNNRKTVSDNLPVFYIYTQWRLKAGKLLGVDKTDSFKEYTENLDPSDILNLYEFYRRLLLDQILREQYILPEYREYTDKIIELYAPLGDTELIDEDYMSMTIGELKEAKKDPETKLKELVHKNKYVTEALKIIEGMTIYTIEDSYYSIRDTLRPYLKRQPNDQE